MNITIGGKHVDDLADQDIADAINGILVGYGYRRMRQNTTRIWVAIIRAFDASGVPMTSRGVFYQLESAGVVPKTERGVNQVGDHVLNMRRKGIVPYGWIRDGTRRVQKPTTYDSLGQFLEISKDTYRRALWASQSDYVEIWCEKDTLSGILYDVTAEYDVPLMVTRGFPSDTFIYEAAETIRAQREQGKIAFIYFFGDYDYYGKEIASSTARKLAEYGASVVFEEVAVREEHINQYGLSTRPPKGSKQSKEFGQSVELDAMPVRILREMVRDCIERHINERELSKAKQAEELERQSLADVYANYRLAGDKANGDE